MNYKLNEKQKRFTELVAAGVPAGRAYERAGYQAHGKNANAAAARLLLHSCVATYLNELRKPRKNTAILTLEKKREFLYDIVMTGVADIDGHHPLCQSLKVPGGDSMNMPSKLRAIELDAKLAGELSRKENTLVLSSQQSEAEREKTIRKLVADALSRNTDYGLPCEEDSQVPQS